MDLSWSQTPNSVWWALEKSGSTTSLLGDSLTSPVTPSRMPGSSFAINNFYEYADEPDLGESEEDIVEWMKESQLRGAIRYCQVLPVSTMLSNSYFDRTSTVSLVKVLSPFFFFLLDTLVAGTCA